MHKVIITNGKVFFTYICLFYLVLIPLIQPLYAQLTVDTLLTEKELINKILGKGIKVSNISKNCPDLAIGSFTASGTNLGLDKGIIMTNGKASNTIGPNNSDGTSYIIGTPGDSDLDNILSQQGFLVSEDACILEFDVIPESDIVQFSYVFGSEEYPEYVCNIYNDIFAFLISGPGITGTVNMARIPGTNTPVSIGTLNNGNPNDTTCTPVNAQYYIDNENPSGQWLQYDGLTKVLEAKQKVVPCSTYHMKLAIADVGDQSLDSGIFIEANSLKSSPIWITTANHIDNCNNDKFIFRKNKNFKDSTVTINYTIGGNARQGIDYKAMPDSITIPSGEDSIVLDIDVINNNSTEVVKYITIYLNKTTCSNGIYDSATIYLDDCHNIFIPNAFSPNKDGVNDIFRIRGKEIKQIHLSIYNRWGIKIFETNDLTSPEYTEGWDGTFKGKKLSKGAYVYFVTGKFKNDDSIDIKGNVLLIK